MAAILTDRFRVVLAENFKQRVALGEDPQFVDGNGNRTVSPINLYLFFAKSDGWTNNQPANPIDNQEAAFDIYDQMIGLKKIPSSEIRGVIPNRSWTADTTYDIYRHNYGSIVNVDGGVTNYVEGNNTETHVYETDFYVVTSEYKVYKCLNNNNNNPSTVEPSSTSNAPFTLSDGYVWKYMFSVNANDFERFKSDEYIPIPETSSIDLNNAILPASNYGGAIYNVVIKAAGGNYSTNAEFDIIGDGSNGRIKITSTDASGAITGIKVINPGSGYTFGQINLTGGSGAVLEPIITPKEGMATTGLPLELGAYRLALHCKLENSDFVFGNDFSVVGVIYNPTATSSSSTLVGTKKMTLQYSTPGVSPLTQSQENYDDLLISTPGSGSTASGRIVHYEPDTVNNIYTIYYQQSNTVGAGLKSDGSKPSFVDGETIVIGSETVTIDTVSEPDIVRGSGEIIYIDNRNTISRAQDQTEDFKIILEF
jgi:hypothetical protein